MAQAKPLLAVGAIGEAVRMLQGALNQAVSVLPKLVEDAIFGMKTLGRVREFQQQKHLSIDGQVGAETWAALEPLIQAWLAARTGGFDESAMRAKIVGIARGALLTYGWPTGTVQCDGSFRIAAAQGFGPADAQGYKARQGGMSLLTIYSMAGASSGNCLRIHKDVEYDYQHDYVFAPPGETPEQRQEREKKKAERRNRLNQDIGSWCGIFATYCYAMAGLRAYWADRRVQPKEQFEVLLPNAHVQPGDIGIYQDGVNHHFVITSEAEAGANVHSIDGNLANPPKNVKSPWNSVIAERTYSRAELMSKNAGFLRPKFATFPRTGF